MLTRADRFEFQGSETVIFATVFWVFDNIRLRVRRPGLVITFLRDCSLARSQ